MGVQHVILDIGSRALLPTDNLTIKGGRGEILGVARGQMLPSGTIAVILDTDQLPAEHQKAVGIRPVVTTSTSSDGTERPALISVKLTQSGSGEGVRVLRPGPPRVNPIGLRPLTILDR